MRNVQVVDTSQDNAACDPRNIKLISFSIERFVNSALECDFLARSNCSGSAAPDRERKNMPKIELTRRTLLASAAGCALAAFALSCARQRGLSNREKQTLLRMARQLYPHDALQDSVYADSLASIYRSILDDPILIETLRDGLDALDTAIATDWLAADPDIQVTALRDVENTAFFETVQDAVRTSLYMNPVVWKLIGYEGSSVEHGGYINRGFDDIDWLPDD